MEEKFIITEINRVIMVGKDEYPEMTTSFGHTLQRNELVFHFSGQATVFFDDLILETKPGTIRFLPQGTPKRYTVLRRERGECIDVFFSTDRPVSPEAFVISTPQSEKTGALFKRLFATWASKKEGYYFESLSLLYRIFAEIQQSTYIPTPYKAKIAPAMDMIHNDFLTRDLSLNGLAAICKMGESYFQKLFKKIHGVSPKKYIIQLKINHACELLRLERYSVTQVAQLSRFSDVYFFSRQFKEYMGITPTQFIKKYKSSK